MTAPITPKQLIEIGRSMYGERWKGALADAMDMSAVQIHRYSVGAAPIPEVFVRALVGPPLIQGLRQDVTMRHDLDTLAAAGRVVDAAPAPRQRVKVAGKAVRR